jgi:hypothetical protein
VELENFITLRTGKCKKKYVFLPLLVVSKCCFSSTLDSGYYLAFLQTAGSLLASEGCWLKFLLSDSLTELNVSEYCEYLLVFCTSLQSVMVLAYTVECL